MMPKYTTNAIIAVPVSIRGLANKVAAGFWNDIGDDHSFDSLIALDASNAEWAVCSTPCDEQFTDSILYLQQAPANLHQVLSYVLPRDWPNLTVPTLAEVEQFCSNVKVSSREPYAEVLAEWGMTQKVESF